MLKIGIVGLANVGKSTLFNALLRRQQAMVANYPFATIEPNIGIVPVPDQRLSDLQKVIGEGTPIVPATVQFVDIAGLVKGAATGAGLGNKFLSHIREVDIIAQVVRAFPDEDVIREGSTTPLDDIQIINTELILADLQSIEKIDAAKERNPHKASAVLKLKKELDGGKLARDVSLTPEELEGIKDLQLLTMKKIIYVFNVNTASKWEDLANLPQPFCVIDAKLEAELAQLDPTEQEEYLASLGIKESGVDQFIRLAYQALGLISFLTAGEKEVRAWPIPNGFKAPQAAGTIHTDFEKGFIKAEVVDFKDFIESKGWKGAREVGKARIEGRDYIMKDGDVVEFRVNS